MHSDPGLAGEGLKQTGSASSQEILQQTCPVIFKWLAVDQFHFPI